MVFNENLNIVTNLQVGVVTEFVQWNNTIRLVADVNHYLALVDCNNGTFSYFFVLNCVKAFVVGLFQLFVRFLSLSFASFIGFPIEIFNWRIF